MMIFKRLGRHPFAVPVITLSLLSFVTMGAYVLLGSTAVPPADSHVVQLSVDGKKQTVPTRATTVDDFLKRASVVINNGDVVEPEITTTIDDDNFRINIYRARPVTIFDGEKRIQALSAATTPRSVVAQVGVEVFPEDSLTQELSSNVLRDQVLGDKIVIDRATPAGLNLYGTPAAVRTRAKTVGDLLKEKNVVLAIGDTVQPDSSTVLAVNTQVFVTRNGTQIVSTEEPIAMEIETVEDPSLSFGTQAIRQKGVPGKKLVTYQIELKNDREESRRKIQEVRLVEPVKQVVARGRAFDMDNDKAAVMALAGITTDVDYPYVDYIIKKESRWNPLARNVSSGAYGLGQAYPGSKMAPFGADWETNPVTQLKWANSYAIRRFGSWEGAYNYWLKNYNW